ncbi:MAG: SMC-Scp complex subunit ScpB [Nitrospiraceae bacterium]|nr:MAG: SMC-Scp complex subunit ScpB [Nitrospiraceae bacterium]
MEDREARSVIESLLFISGEPMTIDSLKKITEIDKKKIDTLVKELISDYSLRNSGLLIIEVAEGVQMVTNPASSPYVKKLISTAVPTKLSQPSIETLAIIAYKQPIIKAEIEAIRGVNSDGVVKTLLERRLIRILGRKEVPGRPLMYGTTKEFLQYFGLKDLTELPTLKELSDVEIPDIPELLEGEEGEVQDQEGINTDTSESDEDQASDDTNSEIHADKEYAEVEESQVTDKDESGQSPDKQNQP